ncbi:uncharacterized protein LOC126979905 isoform X3 [Leptidea sinapis]|uniref:uncharacterized protein LOC126979905 isoform X3 n=1 Tax=Leptidea sinapis TaxID=189913 RepID=UPI0021C44D95|nr:uncharacterized protein LOC126979905 isoform X3 [Leptidea sinapis]
MNNHNIEQLHLLPRNEGKIKSYASCADVRAWSHDIRVRNAFLRDWMKTDMPICVIPVHMVSKLLRSMTWRSRGKVTPQCHPGCKSKVVLESICSSCHAVKECIRKEESLQKYYQEEEFETSHWPCEKCLEALKSIKLFWKIILEKVFGIVIPTEDDFKSIRCSSIRSLSKNWEDEIIEQTVFLRKLIPLRRKHDNYDMHTSFDKNYKYISLLQVVHKTNDPRFNDNVNLDSSPRNLDPMELLKKVKRTVGEIVQRELSIVDENQKSAEEAVVVKASYHKNNL